MNLFFENGCFRNEVSSIFKKNDDLHKENYRTVSIVSRVSKVFKRIMYMQIDTFTGDKLTKLLAVFRKNHNTQHCLMSMLEIYKNTLEKGGYASVIFMELSNASDTLNRKLINKLHRLITKLGAYRFERDSLSFMKSYLNDTQHRVRVNNSFSSLEKVIAGVPQRFNT